MVHLDAAPPILGTARTPAVRLAAEPADAGALRRIQILRVGEVPRWDGAEYTLAVTAEHLDMLAASAAAHFSEAGPDALISVTRDHMTWGEAAGWIHGVERDGDGLYALVEWTDETTEAIRAKKWRYTSSEIWFRDAAGDIIWGRDIETTPAASADFIRFSLTNDPAFVGMQPIAAHRHPGGRMARHAALVALAALVGAPDDAHDDALVALAKARLDAKDAEIGVLQGRLADLEAGTAFEAAVRLGRIVPAKREDFVTHWRMHGQSVALAMLMPAGTIQLAPTGTGGGLGVALSQQEAGQQIAALQAAGKSMSDIRRDHKAVWDAYNVGA